MLCSVLGTLPIFPLSLSSIQKNRRTKETYHFSHSSSSTSEEQSTFNPNSPAPAVHFSSTCVAMCTDGLTEVPYWNQICSANFWPSTHQ